MLKLKINGWSSSQYRLLTYSGQYAALLHIQNEIGGFRAFCSNCGTRLMNYAPDKSLFLSVIVATIDTPLEVKPLAHVNLESKASWYQTYAGIPSFQALPENLLG